MRMLHWLSRLAARNEHIRNSLKIILIEEKLRETHKVVWLHL